MRFNNLRLKSFDKSGNGSKIWGNEPKISGNQSIPANQDNA